MIRFAMPDISSAEIFKAKNTLQSGWLTKGKLVTEFEDKIKEICDVDHAVCYDSCTAAMEMSLRALDIGPGDEVITTPFTYSATAEVIRNVGAKVVFCDLKQGTFEMDYDKLAELINEHTKAVIPVDYGGVPCRYGKLFQAVSSKADIYHPSTPLQKSIGRVAIIADAAHSFGATYFGRPIGGIADFTCFSFHVLKPITTGGEGGAVVWQDFYAFDNERLERRLRLLGDHGQTGKGERGVHGREWEYDISLFGYNHIMTDVDAAVGLAQLGRMPEIFNTKSNVTRLYMEFLPGCVEPALNHNGDNYESSMHLFPVRIPGAGENERNAVFAKMLDAGIQCNVHYKPLPMFTAYIREGFDIEDYPVAYETYKNLITLPYHNGLTINDIELICNELRKAVQSI